jgi:microcystin-dependent protein
MSQPYVGEIRIFAGNFNPNGWAFCDGAVLPISENETLFQLIGTTYGGDGQETFALPDLRGRIPLHQGTNPGSGNNYQLAQSGGVETVTLSTQQIPNHTHTLMASTDPGNATGPAGNVLSNPFNTFPYFPSTASVPLNAQSITPVGGSQPHENLMPYLCLNFIISLFGIFPSQT